MILFPAIDIKDGRCVRLRQGKKDDVTVFGEDPVAAARHWVDLGARFLHVVDLDGAFDGKPVNFGLVRRICCELGVSVQLGGGIRDLETASAYLEAGVTRLIIGTMALENPDLFASMCRALPGRVGVSLDADDGRLKTKGWVADAGLTVADVLPRLEDLGVSFLVYTDIGRDGMHAGVNTAAMERLCSSTGIPVVAAGGVTNLDDLKALWPLTAKGLEGVITGRAIYEGTLDFKAAQDWIAGQKAGQKA
ncbi:1-(5-phosphoribosyl)-5-(5-phosphoribosylamino)methylideneamino imidazole-4-carboxamide isomerase [Desulfovibrio sp. X2]|uniref:1-(5-phosphoribosyl)-5-[(5- phosphoribosylamino)methylideneamino]imidazole-4- carboxamide isomerase n=1 Tax=Desulfovibrio sp. X2 TaxID=941449 RepID=UPI000358E747|nr:1-(5-phosphoribosyl)-5-[(5-phosphoribosylamino)methylideneamino]imidazole-4-carboxamide isomerase [Desulfovibrio sp. X2]EPR42816.1 1-(5-phosphoribosyl)-5-(5-phosphoribosylamino)methylideneamino imidazole-4-carboxamide isomerase [Desulfovibrio sp. X2]